MPGTTEASAYPPAAICPPCGARAAASQAEARCLRPGAKRRRRQWRLWALRCPGRHRRMGRKRSAGSAWEVGSILLEPGTAQSRQTHGLERNDA